MFKSPCYYFIIIIIFVDFVVKVLTLIMCGVSVHISRLISLQLLALMSYISWLPLLLYLMYWKTNLLKSFRCNHGRVVKMADLFKTFGDLLLVRLCMRYRCQLESSLSLL